MKNSLSRSLVWSSSVALLLGVVGCSGLLPKPPLAPTVYTLDAPVSIDATSVRQPSARTVAKLALVVHVPQSAAGYDSSRIVYSRDAQRLDAYAHSVWVDTPAQMLMPMMVAAIESTDAFAAVVAAPSSARADIELDTQILRLQHDFGTSPSRARFTLRATLIDSVTRHVMASQEFDAVVDSTSEDARGGVVAAHGAVRQVLTQLAGLCREAPARWKALHNDKQAERGSVRP